ncbi:helix-turn-helix domain-containing protein, partial [Lactobacillus gasseri]|uniref:helix-turn-helix domain-containing protein n=1 Tax=Lactobacillus gasseri TaxID=1596 RepID=UPI000ABCB20C
MDSLHSTMNRHVKGKHLSFEERVIIQLRLKDGCSLRSIFFCYTKPTAPLEGAGLCVGV